MRVSFIAKLANFFFSMRQCTVINALVFALQGAFGMLVWILPTFFYYGRCASGGCTNLLDEDAVRIQPLDRYNFLIFYGSFFCKPRNGDFDTKSGKK